MVNTVRFPQRRGMKAVSLGVLAMAVAARAHGQTYWTGTGSDNWNDSTCWSTGMIPTSSNDVFVGYNYGSTTFTNPGSLTLNITANAVANNLFSQSMLNLNSGAQLTLNGNLTTSSTFTLAGTSTQSSYLQFTNPATLSGTFVFGGQNGIIDGGTGTLNIAAGSYIHGPGNGTLQGTSMLNQGVIASDGEGYLTLKPTTLDNIGLICATNSSTLYIQGASFDNTEGKLFVTGISSSTISSTSFNNAAGTISVSDYSGLSITGNSFINTGTTISVTGGSSLGIYTQSLDNTGGTLWAQGGSTITVGKAGSQNTIVVTDAQLGTLRTSDSSQISLTNIEVDNTGNTLNVGSWGDPSGSVVLGPYGYLNNGKVAGSSLAFAGGTANNVEFLDAQTITGQLTIEGTTRFDAPITVYASAQNSGGELYIQTPGTYNLTTNVNMEGGGLGGNLNIEPGVTVAGTGDFGGVVVNQGSILANQGGTLEVEGAKNEGTISVSNASKMELDLTGNEGRTISVTGGSTLVLGSGYQSRMDNTGGTITASGGSTIQIEDTETAAQLGTLTAADTSQIFLAGKLDNTGNTLNVSSWGPAGSVVLDGTLMNGKVAGSVGFRSDPNSNPPIVQNVEFLAAETLSNVTLKVTNGAQFDGGLTLGTGSEVDFTNSENLANNITIGSGTYIKIISGLLTVESSATIDGPGWVIISGAGELLNQGSIVANGDSDMNIRTTSLENQGTIGVAGNRVIYTNANFVQDSSGVLSFVLNSNSQYGKMNFYGTASLDGSVDVSLLAGYTPTVGTEWDIMNFTQGYSANLTAPTGYALIYDTNSIYLEATAPTDDFAPTPTPEPKSVLVLAVGGLCVFFKRRRRRMLAV